jgi:hypothetical protein
MAYIGTSPSNGVRRIHTYTATAGQTTFTGSSTEGVTLSYADTNYIDVFQNGVLLGSADYTSTSGTSVVLAQGASVSDLVVIVVYDVFSVADTVSKTNGGSFDSAVTMSGGLVVADAGNIGSASDTDAMAISSGGVVNFTQTPTLSDKSLVNTPAFLAKMSANQDVSDATNTKVTFDTEVFDTDSKYDHSTNYRFTPAVAGTYFLYTQVLALSNNNTEIVDYILSIRKNGTSIYSSRHNPSANYANQFSLSIQVADVANTTDYYEVFAYIDDLSGDPDIDATLGSGFGVTSFFGAYKLAGI